VGNGKRSKTKKVTTYVDRRARTRNQREGGVPRTAGNIAKKNLGADRGKVCSVYSDRSVTKKLEKSEKGYWGERVKLCVQKGAEGIYPRKAQSALGGKAGRGRYIKGLLTQPTPHGSVKAGGVETFEQK